MAEFRRLSKYLASPMHGLLSPILEAFPDYLNIIQHSRCSCLAAPSALRRAYAILLLFFIGLSFPLARARAEVDLTDVPLEALMQIEVPKVYGASKVEQKTTQAPASVTVITADEIKKMGHRTLASVLQTVQGFNVSYDRNYAFLGSRGVSLGDNNSRILLLVDGHRVNNNLNDGALIDSAFILDIDLVDRIEIIRGPGSIMYGNNAFFGVINVITRQGKQLNGAEVTTEFGSFNTSKARVTYGKELTNGLEFLFSGTYYDSGGNDRLYYKEFDTATQNNGVAESMDDDTYYSGFGSLGYRDFSFQSAFVHREKANPTAQYTYTTFNDPRLRTTDERGYSAVKYTHSFDDIMDATARIYYDRSTYGIGYPQSVYSGSNLVYSAYSQEKDVGEWWGAELQLTKKLWDRHLITLGAEYRDDYRQESRIYSDTTTYTDTRTNRQSFGVYGQGDVAVFTNLHLVGGVRYDQYGDFKPAVNPRVALIYNPFETATIKAIYGTAFRAPNFTELSDSRFQDIKPETITSYELVYEQEIGKHFRSSISGFYNQMDDLIVFDSGSFTNFNANTRGMEIALESFWPSGIWSRASYSLQQTRNSSVGWDMPDSPNHMVKLNLSVPIVKDKLFAGVEFRYDSERYSLHNTTDSSGQPITVLGEDAASYGIVNLTLYSQNLVKNLEFSATIYNLLDRKYSDPASRFHTQDLIEQDGRSFRLKATYRF